MVFLKLKTTLCKFIGFAHDGLGIITQYDTFFVLKNKDNGKCYKLNTAMKEVEELKDTGMYLSGLMSKCHLKFLPKGNYDLMIYYNNNRQNTLLKTNLNFEME